MQIYLYHNAGKGNASLMFKEDQDIGMLGDFEKIYTNDLYSYYCPDASIICDRGLISDAPKPTDQKTIDYINALQGFDLVIFTDNNSITKDLYDYLQTFTINKPWYVTSSCTTDWGNPNPQIVYFPEEEYITRYLTSILDIPISEQRTHKFSCLNANKWSHRVLTYIELYKKPYFNDILFSWGRKTHAHEPGLDEPGGDMINDLVLTDEEWATYRNMPQRVITHKEDDTSFNDKTIQHPAFMSACVNIITETRSRNLTPNVTEKTFKPVQAGQFFLIVGSMGLIDYMRKIGLDVFDDIIDHSYDSIKDDRQRIMAIMAEVDRLEKLDLFALHKQCLPRFAKNRAWIASMEFVEQFGTLDFKKY